VKKTLWIDIVREDGVVLLSIEPYGIPEGMSIKEYVDQILPGICEIYETNCFYIYLEDGESVYVH
jgi:hypothetical protein